MGTATESKPHQVRVSDLAAAALLLAEGCRLAAIEPTGDPRRRTFVIAGDGETIQRLLSEFARGEAVVDLDPYLTAQRLLKERLYRSARVQPLDVA